jgi:hypothetical protein
MLLSGGTEQPDCHRRSSSERTDVGKQSHDTAAGAPKIAERWHELPVGLTGGPG